MITTDRTTAASAAGDPFSAFERTPALLAACQALQPTQLPNDSERMLAAFSATYDADPADPSMAYDLARFCDGWQAALAADEMGGGGTLHSTGRFKVQHKPTSKECR